MNRKSLVSVIVIFWNAEKFIEEAIESVFTQTYENWELLLVDDGSSDSSTELALRHVTERPGHVRYLEHDGHLNRGMSAARNLGISNAKGEYIALLDADDVWLPHKLEQQVAILDSQPEVAMVYGPTQWWYSWSGQPEDSRRDSYDFVKEFGFPLNTAIKPPTLLPLLLRVGAAAPCLCSILVRREAVEEIGGFEEEFAGLYEDQAFYAKLYLRKPVFVASQCWARYRQHPDSCCAIVAKTRNDASLRLFFLNWLQGYLSEQKVEDTEIWKALQRALWPYRHPALYRLHPMHLVRQMKQLLKITARHFAY